VPGRISGEQPYPGWSRRAAVPGSSPAYSRILDRVDIATGGGADGEGELVPPPLSLTLQIPYLRRQPHPVRASVGIPIRFSPAPPLHPRLRRSSPAPTGGRGPCVAIPGGQPYPGWSWWAAVPGSSPGSPHDVDRGEYRHGGWGRRGGGTRSPSPVSHAPDTLLLPATPTPLVPSQEDTRALLPAALIPPGLGAVPGRIPGGQPCPGSSAGAGFLEGQGR